MTGASAASQPDYRIEMAGLARQPSKSLAKEVFPGFECGQLQNGLACMRGKLWTRCLAACMGVRAPAKNR
jgi:hypothetical protein